MYENEDKYYDLIMKWSKYYKVLPRMILATIGKESSFKEKAFKKDLNKGQVIAVSYGLMQITFPTAVEMGFPNDVSRYKELMEPNTNIRYGTAYLAHLIYKWGYTNPYDLYAAYNGGPDEPKNKNPDGSFKDPDVQLHVEQFKPIYEYFKNKEAQREGSVTPGNPTLARP